MKKIPILIAASTLAVIALVLIQVNWLQHSRSVMEEEFSHRVYMALCSAVENLPKDEKGNQQLTCSSENQRFNSLLNMVDENPVFEQTLEEAFEFYKIDLDYEISFTQECLKTQNDDAPSGIYQCCVNPYATNKSETKTESLVNLLFPNKSNYILGKMRFMLIASMLILLFIASVFIWANYSLWKQQKISQINVDFFNNMAHEFRTPLTNIALATNLATKKSTSLKDNTYLHIVQKENQKLMRQVERVLYLAKVENGEYHLQKEAVSVQELLNEVLSNMQLQIEERQAEINIQNITSDLIIQADKLHLGNVFRNLLDNALKYSGTHPKITLSTKVTDHGISILFQDNGIGISKHEQQLVFEKFQRSTKGNLHNQKGFGLGLAYVKMIVELHKGFVRIISDLQKGCRFEVFLPS